MASDDKLVIPKALWITSKASKTAKPYFQALIDWAQAVVTDYEKSSASDTQKYAKVYFDTDTPGTTYTYSGTPSSPSPPAPIAELSDPCK